MVLKRIILLFKSVHLAHAFAFECVCVCFKEIYIANIKKKYSLIWCILNLEVQRWGESLSRSQLISNGLAVSRASDTVALHGYFPISSFAYMLPSATSSL